MPGLIVASRIAGQKLRRADLASASVTSSRSRPRRWTQLEVGVRRSSSSCVLVNGIVTSGARPGATPKNPGGVTPMMVKMFSSIRSVRPTTVGSLRNRRCQAA
jgi:hypothetical protein